MCGFWDTDRHTVIKILCTPFVGEVIIRKVFFQYTWKIKTTWRPAKPGSSGNVPHWMLRWCVSVCVNCPLCVIDVEPVHEMHIFCWRLCHVPSSENACLSGVHELVMWICEAMFNCLLTPVPVDICCVEHTCSPGVCCAAEWRSVGAMRVSVWSTSGWFRADRAGDQGWTVTLLLSSPVSLWETWWWQVQGALCICCCCTYVCTLCTCTCLLRRYTCVCLLAVVSVCLYAPYCSTYMHMCLSIGHMCIY